MFAIAKRLWIRHQPDSGMGAAPVIAPARPAPLPGRWQCDLADDSLTWSPGVFELFGIPRGARLDRREIVTQFVDESRDLLDRLRTNAIANAASFTFDASIRRLDGEHRLVRITADVVVKGGRVTHLYGQKLDITADVGSVAA